MVKAAVLLIAAAGILTSYVCLLGRVRGRFVIKAFLVSMRVRLVSSVPFRDSSMLLSCVAGETCESALIIFSSALSWMSWGAMMMWCSVLVRMTGLRVLVMTIGIVSPPVRWAVVSIIPAWLAYRTTFVSWYLDVFSTVTLIRQALMCRLLFLRMVSILGLARKFDDVL